MSLRDLQPNQSVIIIGIIVKSIKALNDLLSPHINIIVNKNAMFPLIMINIVVGETKTIDDNRREPHTIGQYNLLHNIIRGFSPFGHLSPRCNAPPSIQSIFYYRLRTIAICSGNASILASSINVELLL